MPEMGAELPSSWHFASHSNPPKSTNHHGVEARPWGPSRENKQKNSEIGAELRSPEEFPHGNLTHTSVVEKRAPKNAELGGGKKKH
jgi:hypothetical protein